MCGIAGILSLDDRPVEPERLHRMAALQAHRGPDGQGFALLGDGTAETWRDPLRAPRPGGRLGLAFRRLAILDLSEAAHQPMSTPDGRFWLVFNWEIYNHGELRRDLESRGEAFRSRSDAEVLLRAWALWGEAALPRLEGMFAFAVWDRRESRLTLARDRFGIKPLCYASIPGAFAFASEIKPVLAALDLPVRPRDAAAHDLLVRGRKDHRRETFFEGVLQLMPGEVMAAGGPPRKHYDLAAAVRSRGPATAEEFRDALAASVRSHLRSDVPTGTCLSGGLDSSSLVVRVAALRGEPGSTPSPDGAFHTFSARSGDPALDEGRYIDAVTARTGLPNHPVLPEADGFLDALPDLLRFQEEPVSTGSPYAQWLLMQEASARGVKVLLDGQGADELLGGYPGMHLAAAADALRSLRFGRAHRTFWEPFPGFPAARGLAGTLWLCLFPALPSRPPGGIRRILSPELLSAAEPEEAPEILPSRFGTERLLQVRRHLPALLHYEDRSSMAHGIEARVPFLDRRLAETALALPADALFREGCAKAVLREEALPDLVRGRRDKIGFTMPDAAWRDALASRFGPGLEDLRRGSPWLQPGTGPLPLGALLLELWRSVAASPAFLAPR